MIKTIVTANATARTITNILVMSDILNWPIKVRELLCGAWGVWVGVSSGLEYGGEEGDGVSEAEEGVGVVASLDLVVGAIEGFELETRIGLGGSVGTGITVGTEGALVLD